MVDSSSSNLVVSTASSNNGPFTYHIRPARHEDIPILARLWPKAFGGQAFTRVAFEPEWEEPEACLKREKELEGYLENDGKNEVGDQQWVDVVVARRQIPATDDSHRNSEEILVGYSHWTIFHQPPANNEKSKPANPPQPEKSEQELAAMSRSERQTACRKAVFDPIMYSWSQDMRNIPHARLSILGVLPDHRGQGLATQLMKKRLDQLDGIEQVSPPIDHLPAWLSASEMGLNLYLKLGYELTSTIKVDLKKYGGEEGETKKQYIMLRKAHNQM